jgi:hypothetical protein
MLAAYFQRRLSPAQLLALDDHVTQCGKCRERLRAIVSADYALVSLRNSVERDTAFDDHLPVDRLREYVADRMDTIDRELAASHVGVCNVCRSLADRLAADDRRNK